MRPLLWSIAVAAAVVAPLVGCTLQTGEDAFHIDGDVHGVVVETESGAVRLVAGGNSDVHVEAQMSWAGQRPEVRVDYRGGVLHLSSPCLEQEEACEVSFVITVPAHVRGKVSTLSGDIILDDSFEAVSIETQSGVVHRAGEPRG